MPWEREREEAANRAYDVHWRWCKQCRNAQVSGKFIDVNQSPFCAEGTKLRQAGRAQDGYRRWRPWKKANASFDRYGYEERKLREFREDVYSETEYPRVNVTVDTARWLLEELRRVEGENETLRDKNENLQRAVAELSAAPGPRGVPAKSPQLT